MAEDAEDVAVLLWYCWEESYMGEKRKGKLTAEFSPGIAM
jgi:hypothetical protein